MLGTHQVSLRYRRGREALRDLTWQLADGARVVLLGPNGAGKSTLMALLAGALEPSSGTITLDGSPADRVSLARQVARMPQQVTALPRLTSAEQVAYAGWLGGLTESEARSQTGAALAAVGLSDRSGDRADSLSGGQLRRLGLAEILVRRTRYLLLDEPSAGLDPQERARFRTVLGALDEVGFVVSTHETHDISDIFDVVCVLHEGALLYQGTPAELLTATSSPTLEEAYISLMTRQPE